jgi:trimethylamine---corrinoid protein Co-methyltransferase
MRMRTRMEMRLLDEPTLEDLFQKALRVWKTIPFRVQGTGEFFEYLTDFGCRVEGELVHFDQPVIDKVLDRVREEKRKSLAGRRADEWPESELRMFTHGQGLHICDLETNRLRPATERDLATWCHTVDAIGIEDRHHPTFIPTDVPRATADFHAFATIILNSKKPHRVSVYSAKSLPLFIEACRIVTGSPEAVRQDRVFATKCWVNSPFMITRENIEIAMEARRVLGWPIEFGHMPVAGAAGPITVAGSLVQNTAESLALCAMRLAVDDVPHGITPTTTIMDMKDAAPRQSGPDLLLHILAGNEMYAYLFGGRPTATLLGVGAKVVCPQSVYEKAMMAMFNFAAGTRELGVGCLCYSDVGSPVQLVLDVEMGRYLQYLFREVKTQSDYAGLQTILETAPRGAYFLETDHTAAFFREETWRPAFLDHRVPMAWMSDPADMIDRARDRARELQKTAVNQCPLSDAQQRMIRELLAEADRIAL